MHRARIKQERRRRKSGRQRRNVTAYNPRRVADGRIRDTYEYVLNEGVVSPCSDKRTIVVTSRPIENIPRETEIWSRGIEPSIPRLRAWRTARCGWFGSGRLQMAFLERGALDEAQIFVIPEMIGGGVPRFPPTCFVASPSLVSATARNRGCVRLHYAFD